MSVRVPTATRRAIRRDDIDLVDTTVGAVDEDRRRSFATAVAHLAYTVGRRDIVRIMYNKYGADLTAEQMRTMRIGVQGMQTLDKWLGRATSAGQKRTRE